MAFDRRDLFRSRRQALLVEEVVPYDALHPHDISPSATGMNVTATLGVEDAEDRAATWVEEAISYSLGSGRVLRWLDRWLINPLLHLGAAYKTNKAFRRLQAIVEKPRANGIPGSGREEQVRSTSRGRAFPIWNRKSRHWRETGIDARRK